MTCSGHFPNMINHSIWLHTHAMAALRGQNIEVPLCNQGYLFLYLFRGPCRKKLGMTHGLFYFFISPARGQPIYTIYGSFLSLYCLSRISEVKYPLVDRDRSGRTDPFRYYGYCTAATEIRFLNMEQSYACPLLCACTPLTHH